MYTMHSYMLQRTLQVIEGGQATVTIVCNTTMVREQHQCHQEVAWGVELLPVPLSRKGVLRRPHLLQGGADPPGSRQDAPIKCLAG